jgi:hypothetical protein
LQFDHSDLSSQESLELAWNALRRTNDLLLFREQQGAKKNTRLTILFLLLALAGLVGTLLSRRVARASIEVDARLDSVAFDLMRDAILPKGLPSSVAVLDGELSLSGEAFGCSHTELRPNAPEVAYVDAYAVPAGTHVALEYAKNRVKATFEGVPDEGPRPTLPLTVSLPKGTRVCGCHPVSWQPKNGYCQPIASDASLEVRPSRGTVEVKVEAKEISGSLLELPIHVSSFQTARKPPHRERTAPVQSAISSGTVYYDGLEGMKREIREGQLLSVSLAPRTSGTVQGLAFLEREMRVRFSGNVTGASLTAGPYSSDLMPTELEALTRRHSLLLFCSAMASAFAFLLAMRRWWKGQV